MIPYVVLIIGFLFLIKGADFLVDGASLLAKKLNVSDLAVGLTVVAFGILLPELFVNIFASFRGNTDIAIGNIVGSNIFNIFFILGVSAIIKPLPFSKELNIDVGMTILVSLFLFVCMFTGRKHNLDRWEGVFFFALYFGYIWFLIARG